MPSATRIRAFVKSSGRGLLRCCVPGPARSVRILAYHSVDCSGSALSVTAEELRCHLEWLAAAGFRGLRARQLIERVANVPSAPAAKEVFLTFDDGYENFLTAAVPVLRECHFPATVFIVPRLMGQTAQWYHRDADGISRLLTRVAGHGPAAEHMRSGLASLADLPLLTWEQAQEVANSGCDVASHSDEHRFLTTLDEADLDRDLASSRQALLDHLGTCPEILCYPYGDSNERVASAARRAGFQVGLMADTVLAAGNPLQLRRWAVAPGLSRAQFHFLLSRAADWEADLRLTLRRLRGK